MYGILSNFQWLQVDRKALLKEQQSFDAKSSIWIPCAKDGFTKAEIVSTKGDDVTVKNLGTMQVIFISLTLVEIDSVW